MTKFKRHTTEEMNNWEKTQANELAKIRASQHLFTDDGLTHRPGCR